MDLTFDHRRMQAGQYYLKVGRLWWHKGQQVHLYMVFRIVE